MATETAPTPAPAPEAVPAPLSRSAARRLAAVERTVYGAAGAVAAVGPQLDNPWLHGGALAVGAGTLWALWSRTRDGDHGRLLASTYRALPALGLSGAYAAALAHPGTSWWEMAVPLATAALAGLAAPWTRSRGVRHTAASLPAVVEAQGAALASQDQLGGAARSADPYADGLARMWAASPMTGDTRLTHIRHQADQSPDFTAVIEAPPGAVVPHTIDERVVAAVFDVPPIPAVVELAEIPDSGPGYLAVRVTPTRAKETARELTPDEAVRQVWAEKVAARGGVAPGMNLVDHRLNEDRLVMRIEAEDGEMIRLPRLQITRALRPLGVTDPELVMVETDGLATGVVTVYRQHPLINIREATVEDLTMDASGRFVLGLQHDGRPARWQLYDPELGAVTDLVVGASGSGKSVTLNTILAAERRNGVVSLVADAQDGMSLPEANGRVAHFGAGIAAVGATLSAACSVADYRQDISSSRRWGGFKLGDPWPLANVTIDEINLILGADAEVPREYRRWVTGMIARIQHTGRKMGLGIRFAGQSIHVTDLGDADKVRAGAKRGNVWLGRVDSDMTASMASNMVTDGTQVTPIPQTFGSASADVEAAWDGKEATLGPPTAGRAWHFRGGRTSSMRTFKAVKKDRTFPGLVALYEDTPTIPELTPPEQEVFQEAYGIALRAAEMMLAEEDGAQGQTGETDGESGDAKSSRPGPPSVPTPTRTLADRVLDALAHGPLRTRDIRAAVGVGTEGGPAAKSVDNALYELGDAGRVARVAHGTWALASTLDEDQEDDE